MSEGERKSDSSAAGAAPLVQPAQLYLLRWLGDAEFSQYGECYGKDLDALVSAGLAQVHPSGEHQSGFIAQGNGDMYRAVSLTDAGRAALSKSGA